MNEDLKLVVSSSPHIRTPRDTRAIMLDVIVALLPALAAGVIFFGAGVLVVTAVSVASCVAFEWLYRKLLKKSCTVGDLSAVVTGLLLAFTLPPTATWWMAVIGALFAIVLVKQLFGGIGKNFLNPALAGRAFLLASYAVLMTTWKAPAFASGVDAASYATPLASLHQGTVSSVSIGAMFIGNVGGCIGEVSALALLLGGAWLVYRRVITVRIPVSFVATVAVVTLLFPRGNNAIVWMLQNVLSGGLLLGALFMATDYCTSPVTPKGQIIYGVGCGLITVLIRYFGSYPEGVSYAILIMNLTVWMLDKATAPRRFGVVNSSKAVSWLETLPDRIEARKLAMAEKAAEKAAAKAKAAEAEAEEEPAAEEPVAVAEEESVAEEIEVVVEEEPVAEEPVIEAEEEPSAEEAEVVVEEEPAVEEPVAEVEEEPVVEEAEVVVEEEPVAEETVAEVEEEPVAEEPVAEVEEEPVAEEPVTEVEEEPAVEETEPEAAESTPDGGEEAQA